MNIKNGFAITAGWLLAVSVSCAQDTPDGADVPKSIVGVGVALSVQGNTFRIAAEIYFKPSGTEQPPLSNR